MATREREDAFFFRGHEKEDVPQDGGIYLAGSDGKFYSARDVVLGLTPPAPPQNLHPTYGAIGLALIAVILAIVAAIAASNARMNTKEFSDAIASDALIKQLQNSTTIARNTAAVAVGKDDMDKAIAKAIHEQPAVKIAEVEGLNDALKKIHEDVAKANISANAVAVAQQCQQQGAVAQRVVAKQSVVGKQPPATPQRQALATSVGDSKPWAWYNYESSNEAPMPCLADRPITGKPARCSSVTVFPRQGNETEDKWTTRAAASQGVVGTNRHIGKVM